MTGTGRRVDRALSCRFEERGAGQNLATMSAWVHEREPGPSVHYEADHDSGEVDVYSRMYAAHAEVEAIGRVRGADDDRSGARRAPARGLPFILQEYAQRDGQRTGGLLEYQQLFTYPRCQGGFVWE